MLPVAIGDEGTVQAGLAREKGDAMFDVLRLEAFSALNTVHLNQPGNQIGSPTFGQITSAEDGRIVQLGIKYLF